MMDASAFVAGLIQQLPFVFQKELFDLGQIHEGIGR
jgi:hypothetical protein